MSVADVAARAREAVREGDRFLAWRLDPASKKIYLERRFLKDQSALTRRRERRAITTEEFDLDLGLLRKRRDRDLEDPALARAAQWYRDAHALFSPPENRWTRRARLFGPALRQTLREESPLRELVLPDTLLGDEPGETPDYRLVYSLRDPAEAGRLFLGLRKAGMDVRLGENPAAPAGGARAILVREADFWNTHAWIKSAAQIEGPLLVQSP
jgi:hypothetical protein